MVCSVSSNFQQSILQDVTHGDHSTLPSDKSRNISMKLIRHQKLVLKVASKTFLIFTIFIFIVCYPRRDTPSKYDGVEEKVKTPFSKPWYFEGGSLRPRFNGERLTLWPNEATDDRILNQLMFVPEREPQTNKKKIYSPKLQNLEFQNGSQIFHDFDCPVKNCEIVLNESIADAVVFENFVTKIREKSSLNQVWILHSLESPLYSGKVIQQTCVNWTASYRQDSDLVTPYDKWVYYDENVKSAKLKRNFAAGKTKKVAWFVSNCRSNNKRLEYARVLGKYISVDIYGSCGDKICLKSSGDSCRKMISKNYKFYLAFENANCRDYITEKFYWNALRLDVIPIVMGPPREDYEKVAPYNSFIHVEDFPTPKHLADYLYYLDENDDRYNSYFLWKGAGEFINTYFMCRLCAMLHAERAPHYYHKITRWWRRPGICTRTFWNDTIKSKLLKSLKNFKGTK